MKRDGSLKSVWQDSVSNYQPVNTWEKDKEYDVLIVGAGITGLTTALLLQAGGKTCIIAEAQNIGFGTTGGTTAHLNTMMDTPYSQVAKDFDDDSAKLLAKGTKEAINQIEHLVNIHGIDCDFAYKAAYLYAEKEEEIKILDDIHNGAEQAGLMSDEVKDIPVPIPFIKAYKFGGQARIHPTKYLDGLAHQFEKAGGVILQQCLVSSMTNEDGHIIATTSLGDIKARNLVYGTHIPPGINIFSFRCAPYRSYVMAFTLKSGSYPADFAYDMQDPYHYFRTHEIDGKKYIIAGGCDHKTAHNENTDYVFTELEAYLHKYFDIDTIPYRWSSQYYEPVDGLPYIGAMPGQENVFLGTGYGGNGMIYGSLAGRIITDLITSGHSAYAELFAPDRVKMIAGFSNFIKENADVVSMFISKRLNYEHITQMAELAPGDAKVVKLNGQPVALYKDDQGAIHALDPVCPHAKCIVVWNGAEKSWDCPCHGGRFSCTGTLLNGPAQKGLTEIGWDHL